MRYAKVEEGRAPIYRCTENMHLTITAKPCEEWVIELVQRRLAAPDATGVTGGDDHSDLTDQILTLRSRLDGLADDYADGIIDREQMQRASTRLRDQIAEANAELVEVEKKDAALAHRGTDLATLTTDQQRTLITSLLTVTAMPATKRGGQSREFDYARLHVEWV